MGRGATRTANASPAPRGRRGQDTRRRVTEAAAELFTTLGYGATTMQAIADRAGVHVQTIYLAFGSKSAVLAAAAAELVAGDEDPESHPGVRAWAVEIQQTPDAETKLRLYVHHIADVAGRITALFDMMRATAPSEPEVARFLASAEDGRRQGPLHLFAPIADTGRLRGGLTVERAADMTFAIVSPATVRALHERGWTGDQIEHWLGDLLVGALLEPVV
jgi:AcrR family transcriptional regulator